MDEEEFEEKLEKVRLLRRQGLLTEEQEAQEKWTELKNSLWIPSDWDRWTSDEWFGRLKPSVRRMVGRLVTEQGRIYQELNELPEARQCFVRALNIHEAVFQSTTDKNDKEIAMLDAAYAGFDLFYIEYLLKGPEEKILFLAAAAGSAVSQAIEIIGAESETDKFTMGNLCYKLGFIRQVQENYKEAFKFYNQALDFQEESGDEGGMGLTFLRLDELYLELATTAGVQSLRIFHGLGEESKITEIARIHNRFEGEIERHLRECQENSRLALRVKAEAREFAKSMERVLEKQERAKKPRTDPVAGAKSILGLLNDKIEKAHELLLYGEKSLFLSLFPESFLEGAESFSGDLGKEYLDTQRAEIPQRQYKALEEMLGDFEKLMWPMQPEEMSEEEKKEISDDLRGILYNVDKILLSASGLISAARDIDLRGVCELWKRYLTTNSFFLDELEEIMVDVSLMLDPTRDAAKLLDDIRRRYPILAETAPMM